MLKQFKDYYRKAKMNQEMLYQGGKWTKEDIDDDLVYHVPIYDVVNRRYAAFSNLLEAVKRLDDDPKGNGKYFNIGRNSVKKMTDDNFMKLSYLFRLCGSGINYKPKSNRDDEPFGTHGFGNFWIVKEMANGWTDCEDWISSLPDNKFCDVKGYLLPMVKGGLNKFIKNESNTLMNYLIEYLNAGDKKGIKEVVDHGNKWLLSNGYNRQNFVLTAFAMDMAEYFPELVDVNSDVYVGSNARKCLKLILPHMKTDDALRLLCDEMGNVSKPYDMEDVACDFIRYMDNFQSEDHIKYNNGTKYYNNVCK